MNIPTAIERSYGLLAEAPASQNREHVIRADPAVSIHIGIWIIRFPGGNDEQDVIDIHLPVTIGIRAVILTTTVRNVIGTPIGPVSDDLIRSIPADRGVGQ